MKGFGARRNKAAEGKAPPPKKAKAVAQGVSVYRWAIALVPLTSVLLLAGIWLSQMAADQDRGNSAEREARKTASLLAAGLSQTVGREQRQLAALAADRFLVIEAVETGNLPDAVGRTFPEAGGVMVFPRGFNQAAPAADPPVGYALLDMLRIVEESGSAIPPEVHRLGSGNAHVHFVQPLIANGEVAAHLVVSYPDTWLGGYLPVAASGGRLLIEQRAGDGQMAPVTTLGQADEAAGPIQQASIQGTPWRLSYTPEASPRSFNPLTDPMLLGVAAGGLLALGAAVMLVFAGLQRQLKGDAKVWHALAKDAARGDVKADYPIVLRELRGPIDVSLLELRDMSRDQHGMATAMVHEPRQQARAGVKAKKSRKAKGDIAGDGRDRSGKSVAAPTEPNLKDLLSGLEVEEDMADRKQQAPVGAEQSGPVTVIPTLFRAYDIRGVVGKGLSAEVVRIIGRAIGSEAAERGQSEVVVGRDGRLSSPELADALMDGLRSTGTAVIDIGRVPTPVMYFATYHLNTGSGVVLTGSHNPPDYNGMKIMLGGETLSGDAIMALYERIQREDFVDGHGSMRRQDVVPDYLHRIVGDVTLHRPLRVVVDCGNGVAGEVAPQVLRALGCEVEELFCEVDGTFPNHHPDPSDPANLDDLIRTVREQQADVGLAFDGDGDRLGVVDTSGKIIWPDRQMMLFAMDVLAREPGSDIIFDVKCSSHLARIITNNAGVPVMWRTGHSLIKAKLKESGAPLAGEMSGHIFFNDRWPGFDDGLYAASRLLEILSMDGRESTEIFAELPETVSTPELKIHLQEGEPPEVIRKLVGKARFPQARITTIDGLRVDFPDGWGLVRASNTTPCLVLRFEADDEAALERIKQAFRELLEQTRPGLDTPF